MSLLTLTVLSVLWVDREREVLAKTPGIAPNPQPLLQIQGCSWGSHSFQGARMRVPASQCCLLTQTPSCRDQGWATGGPLPTQKLEKANGETSLWGSGEPRCSHIHAVRLGLRFRCRPLNSIPAPHPTLIPDDLQVPALCLHHAQSCATPHPLWTGLFGFCLRVSVSVTQ